MTKYLVLIICLIFYHETTTPVIKYTSHSKEVRKKHKTQSKKTIVKTKPLVPKKTEHPPSSKTTRTINVLTNR